MNDRVTVCARRDGTPREEAWVGILRGKETCWGFLGWLVSVEIVWGSEEEQVAGSLRSCTGRPQERLNVCQDLTGAVVCLPSDSTTLSPLEPAPGEAAPRSGPAVASCVCVGWRRLSLLCTSWRLLPHLLLHTRRFSPSLGSWGGLWPNSFLQTQTLPQSRSARCHHHHGGRAWLLSGSSQLSCDVGGHPFPKQPLRRWAWQPLNLLEKVSPEGAWPGLSSIKGKVRQVWANSSREWRTGKPGVLRPTGSQRVRHDLATEW